MYYMSSDILYKILRAYHFHKHVRWFLCIVVEGYSPEGHGEPDDGHHQSTESQLTTH